jgi:[ribosomal protein S18]-alanine N-acetyltransferase
LAVLRDARPTDFERLWQIDQRCFVAGISYSREELAAYMGLKDAFTLVAEHDGEIGGFVVARRSRRRGHIITIDVLPETQRSGLGSELLTAAEKRLLVAGCNSVWLETAVDNAAAIAFYKRHGYAVQAVLPYYYLDSMDAFVMAKRIG